MRRDRGGMQARSSGFTYVGILLAVAILSISLAAAGTAWSTVAQRDREAELLFIGEAYRAAIEHYFRQGGQLPHELEQLVQDDRTPTVRRYLRRLYPDPITGELDWEIIRTPDGGITGVHSISTKSPMKRANFQAREVAFKDAECYCDWRFEFDPSARFRRRLR
jgi:type II secretory pathway pseudopilin PulG